MSEYSCWVTDFSSRCERLLKLCDHHAKSRDLDVTLLLAIASATIAIPFDRLTVPTTPHIDSYPKGNLDKLRVSIKDIKDESIKEIIGNLPFGTIENPKRSRPEQWNGYLTGDNQDITYPNGKEFLSIIKHMRNALAHGNIYTTGNPIKRIVMLKNVYDHCLKQPTDEYEYLSFEVKQFRAVIEYWISMIGNLSLRPDQVALLLENAEAA